MIAIHSQSLFFKERWERIAHGPSLIKKSERVKKQIPNPDKKGKSRVKRTYLKFSLQCLLLKRANHSSKSKSLLKVRNTLTRVNRSFSTRSFALLKRATGAICSWFSLVKQQRRIAPVALKIKSKRAKSKRAKSEKVKSERAKERILNPALKSNFCLTVSNECWTFLTFYFLVAAGKPFAYMGGPLLFTQTNWSCQAGIMIGLQSIRPRKTVLEKVIGSAKKT